MAETASTTSAGSNADTGVFRRQIFVRGNRIFVAFFCDELPPRPKKSDAYECWPGQLANMQYASEKFVHAPFICSSPELQGEFLSRLNLDPRNVPLVTRGDGSWSMSEDIGRKWQSLEAGLANTINWIVKITGPCFPTSTALPKFPSQYGYPFLHKTEKDAKRAVTSSRSSFLSVMGVLSYLVSGCLTEHFADDNWKQLAEKHPGWPAWAGRLVEDYHVHPAWVGMLLTSEIGDFTVQRVGCFIKIEECIWMCHYLRHYFRRRIPMVFIWDDRNFNYGMDLYRNGNISSTLWNLIRPTSEEIRKARTQIVCDRSWLDDSISNVLRPDSFSMIQCHDSSNHINPMESFLGNKRVLPDDLSEGKGGLVFQLGNIHENLPSSLNDFATSQCSLPDRLVVEPHCVGKITSEDVLLSLDRSLVDEIYEESSSIILFDEPFLDSLSLHFGFNKFCRSSSSLEYKSYNFICRSIPTKKKTLETFRRIILDLKTKAPPPEVGPHLIDFMSFLEGKTPLEDVPCCLWDLSPGSRSPLHKVETWLSIDKLQVYGWPGAQRSRDGRRTDGPNSHKADASVLYVLSHQDCRSDNYPWILVVDDPSIVAECIRRSAPETAWRTRLECREHIVEFFVKNGIAFATLLVGTSPTTTCRDQSSSQNRPEWWGLGSRSENYEPSYADYVTYETTRTKFLQKPRGRAAVMKGGILWRLCKESVSIERVLEGPSKDSESSDCSLRLTSDDGTVYYDDHLSIEEEDLCCGVYKVSLSGLGGPESHKSWWPKQKIWVDSGYFIWYWAAHCEDWFCRNLEEIRGEGKILKSAAKWREGLKGYDKTRFKRIKGGYREAVAHFMDTMYFQQV